LNDIIVLLLEIINMNLTDKLKNSCSEEEQDHYETSSESDDALRESEDLFRSLFDYSADGILLSAPDGSILAANVSACRMFGRTEEELRQVGLNGIVDTSDPRLAVALQERARTGVFRSEYFHIRKDGTIFPCEATSTLFKDRKGQIRTSTIIRDITERKKAQEMLQEEKEKLLAIINSTIDAIYLFDTNGVILAVNKVGAERLGIEFSRAVGANVYENVPSEIEQRRRSRVGDVIHTKKPVYYEADRRDRWFDTCLYPVITDGIVTGIVLYGRDITERKLAEKELLKEREKFRVILDNAPLGMAMIGKDNAFKYINPKFKELFGYDLNDIADGKIWFRKAFPEPDYRHEVISIWLNQVQDYQGRKPREIPRVFNTTCKDGSTKVVNFLAVTLETGEHIMSCEDITERKHTEGELKKYHEQLEELVEERTLELKATNKELEAFSYSVSHDLRAPLRAVDGFSRILSEEYAMHLPQDAQRYIGLIRTSARQMGKLIDDLLAFSRLGRQTLARQSVAPGDIVRQVLEQFRYLQESRRIEICIGDLPVCQSDPSLLKVVYTNLLSNAFKFTGKCDYTLIEIGCKDEAGEHVYYVKDNGVGFNMKYVDKLFGVFQRLHRADEYEGTGVGLANVQRIIHRHGGRIWVASELDKGTVFYFTLEKGGKLS